MTDLAKRLVEEAAFPHQFEDASGHPNWKQSQGMSLRDWLAGMALTSIGTWMPNGFVGLNSEAALRSRAEWAYAQADAMLKARTLAAEIEE